MLYLRRLRLDDIATSLPELGPTVPDGGYSWIILIGIVAVQLTVPSILSMYGVVLGYLISNTERDFDLWTGNIALTPILFAAFWSLTDPWSRTIVGLKTIPRLVGLIGVALMSVGILASGYLATGGVGAYFAQLSAGAVMGIGASFVIVQSENMLRGHFRSRLLMVLTLKNVAFSLGLVIVPELVFLLLTRTDMQTGMLLMSIVLIPTTLGVMAFRESPLRSATSYTMLLRKEDNELSPRDTPDVTRNVQRENEPAERTDNFYADGEVTIEGPPPVFGSEGSNSYSYEEPEDDVNLFVTPIARLETTWKEEFQTLRLFRFWIAMVAWIGMKANALTLWILLPRLAITRVSSTTFADGVTLLIVVGLGTIAPSVATYWNSKIARWRSMYFGGACWLGSIALLGLAYSNSYIWFISCALMGGISIGGSMVGQEFALRDILGGQVAYRAYTILCTIAGITLLLFSFVQDLFFWLRLVAVIQLIGGAYWIFKPLLGAIRARWPR